MNAGQDQNQHITMSGRVRLARNFGDVPFPGRLGKSEAGALLERLRTAFFGSSDVDGSEYLYVEMSRLDPVDRIMLIEKHLISPDLATSERPGAAIISKDERVSVMLNEEDHLRIQCIVPNADIGSAYGQCARIESVFDKRFKIAYDRAFGYLTSCPTNLGTGMRVSFMLHLPVLVMTGNIKGILEACGKIGVAVRGLYGENTEASGNMFQFSNQGSLGRSEDEIIASIQDIKDQIIGHESRLREALLKQGAAKFEDRVFRAYGTLANARILSSDEFMKLWSDVRLGADVGVVEDITIEALDNMLTLIQPAYIQKMFGRMLNSGERDVYRANLVRGIFGNGRTGGGNGADAGGGNGADAGGGQDAGSRRESAGKPAASDNKETCANNDTGGNRDACNNKDTGAKRDSGGKHENEPDT